MNEEQVNKLCENTDKFGIGFGLSWEDESGEHWEDLTEDVHKHITSNKIVIDVSDEEGFVLYNEED